MKQLTASSTSPTAMRIRRFTRASSGGRIGTIRKAGAPPISITQPDCSAL